MTEKWYWKHRGNTLGPLETEELADLVHHQRVFDRDKVRLADSDQWMSGAEVKAMFAEQEQVSTSDAASRLLNQSARRQLNRQVEGTSGSGDLGDFIRRRIRSTGNFGVGIGEGLAAIVGQLQVVLTRKVLVIGLAVILFSFVVNQLEFGFFQNRRVYEQLSATYEKLEEVQQQQIREISDQELKQFQAETLVQLKRTIESLEAKAESSPASKRHWFGIGESAARVRWNLLGAARDLEAMVAQIAVPSTRSEDFVRKMEEASVYLPRGPSPSRSDPIGTDQAAGFDVATIAVLTVDAILIAGGLFYWFRRRRA